MNRFKNNSSMEHIRNCMLQHAVVYHFCLRLCFCVNCICTQVTHKLALKKTKRIIGSAAVVHGFAVLVLT